MAIPATVAIPLEMFLQKVKISQWRLVTSLCIIQYINPHHPYITDNESSLEE